MIVKVKKRNISNKIHTRLKRKLKIRSKISGTAELPRLSFFRSNKNLYVQLIDDKTSSTILSISTYEKQYKDLKPNIESAKTLAKDFAERLKSKQISNLLFDRNGYKYHGVLKAFCEELKSAGIKI